jgi:hypothetical protein
MIDRLEQRRLLTLSVASVDLAVNGTPQTFDLALTADLGPVGVPDDAVRVHNLSDAWTADETLADWNIAYDAANDVARVALGEAAYGTTMRMPDGNYEVAVDTTQLLDASGATAVDTDGLDDGIARFSDDSLFFVNGDFNRDRKVNLADFGIYKANTGQYDGVTTVATFEQGDANGDGLVNLADFGIVRGQFGTNVERAPSYPGEVTAGGARVDSIKVQWESPRDANGDPIYTAFNIYRGDGYHGVDTQLVASLDIADADPANDFDVQQKTQPDGTRLYFGTWVDETVAEGQWYRYEVRYVTADGETTAPDTGAAHALLTAPTGFRAVPDQAAGEVVLRWKLRGTGQTNLRLEELAGLDNDGNEVWSLVQVLDDLTIDTVTVTGVADPENAQFRIRSENDGDPAKPVTSIWETHRVLQMHGDRWGLQAINDQVMELRWREPDSSVNPLLSADDDYTYLVEYREAPTGGNGTSSSSGWTALPIFESNAGRALIRGLTPGTAYGARVTTFDDGFNLGTVYASARDAGPQPGSASTKPADESDDGLYGVRLDSGAIKHAGTGWSAESDDIQLATQDGQSGSGIVVVWAADPIDAVEQAVTGSFTVEDYDENLKTHDSPAGRFRETLKDPIDGDEEWTRVDIEVDDGGGDEDGPDGDFNDFKWLAAVTPVTLDALSIASTPHPANTETSTATATKTTYVELEDGTTSSSVTITPMWNVGPAASDLLVAYEIEGGGVDGPASGTISGVSVKASLKDAGPAYTVSAWLDIDDGGSASPVISGGGVATIDGKAVVVRIDELVVNEQTTGDAEARTSSDSGKTELYIAEDPDKNEAYILVDVLGEPLSTAAGAFVRWELDGARSAGARTGNFGGNDPSLTLTPGRADRDYKVQVGFDDDADGTLGADEISRTIEVYPVLVEVTNQKAKIELLDENTLTADVHAGGSATPTEYGFYTRIKKVGGAWFELAKQAQDTWTGKGRVAGVFQNGAAATLDGREFLSTQVSPPEVEVQFPDLADFQGNPAVVAAMGASWSSTKSYANATRIREEGFWIMLDTATESYSVTAVHRGNDYPASGGFARLDGFAATIPNDSVADPNPFDQPTYRVGWFHTHPTMEWTTPGLERKVSYSTADLTFSTSSAIKTPGFVYDYVHSHVSASGDLVIRSGHLTSSAATVTHVGTFDRRPTP